MFKDLCISEDDPRVEVLQHKLRDFYISSPDYAGYKEPNFKPEYWNPIIHIIQQYVQQKGHCRVLEFGAGMTSFTESLGQLRSQVTFDVQDITGLTQEYLSHHADHVYICDVTAIEEEYDIIFSTFVWEHLTSPRKTLNHLLCHLTPGGSLVIASPRYDFPGYLCPSTRHLPKGKQLSLSFWLGMTRLGTIISGSPRFLIHTQPALFYSEWFRDADAIHWVSLWDLKAALPDGYRLIHMNIENHGLRFWLWKKMGLLFVRIVKDI
jgi:2-polyprenyl-3-methyl-5-hydroxy-6-metoxy-1,4-benzoquinol methylase